jgi:hypothetical protein
MRIEDGHGVMMERIELEYHCVPDRASSTKLNTRVSADHAYEKHILNVPNRQPSLLCAFLQISVRPERDREGKKGTNGASVSEQVNLTSNQQMRPTLLPLPRIRPLEPLEPFMNVVQSNDSVGGTVPVKEKRDGTASKS